MISGQLVSKQTIQYKRKRADSVEAPLKFPRIDCAILSTEPESVQQPNAEAPRQAKQSKSLQSVVDCAFGADTDLQTTVPQLSPTDLALSCPPVSGQPLSNGRPALVAESILPSHPDSQLTMEPFATDSPPRANNAPNTMDSESNLLSCPGPIPDCISKMSVHNNVDIFLSTKILFKHKELRIIEAEIAKCQIALEQLRRCRAIPYPGQPASEASLEGIITGNGPALHIQPGLPHPEKPAPFGVTDGPYSRHYSRWLLSDSTFDPLPARFPRTLSLSNSIIPRKTRGFEDASISKAKRVSTSMFTQLAAPPSQFPDSKSRLIIKSEGAWVKIVCKRCGKTDSSNIQGFMNHTRIAHGLIYASHTEVVKDCSQPLDGYEAEFARSQAARVYDDSDQLFSRRAPGQAFTTAPLGKPFLGQMLQGPSKQSESGKSLQSHFQAHLSSKPSARMSPSTSQSYVGEEASSSRNNRFVPFTGTPKLSGLLQRRASSVNLQRLGTEATIEIDLDAVEPYISDKDDQDFSPKVQESVKANPGARVSAVSASSSRMPARTPASQPGDLDTSLAPDPKNVAIISTSQWNKSLRSFASRASGSRLSGQPSFAHTAPQSSALDSVPMSPRISPRTVDDPGMMTDDDDEEDDYAHSSDQGEEAGFEYHDPNMNVRVHDDYSEEHLPDYRVVEHVVDACVDTPATYFTSFDNGAAVNGGKRKRGRPRKSA